MFFTRYNILLFQETGKRLGHFRARGWIVPFVALLVLALLLGNIALFHHFLPYAKMRRALEHNNHTAYEQFVRAYDVAFKILALEAEYKGVEDFGSKLSVMLNLDGENGAASAESETQAQTPVYYDVKGCTDLLRLAHEKYEQLVAGMRQEEVLQQQLAREIVLQKQNLMHIPSIWPTRGRFTSRFGYRKNPVTGRVAFHKGIDIAGPVGTPVKAPAAGVVTYAKRFSSYGKTVDIDHGGGLSTRFGHLSKISVQVGQKVKRGDVIGAMGNTGRSVASHLHYEVHKNGRPVNPLYYIMN